jgi:hypothetical protein
MAATLADFVLVAVVSQRTLRSPAASVVSALEEPGIIACFYLFPVVLPPPLLRYYVCLTEYAICYDILGERARTSVRDE